AVFVAAVSDLAVSFGVDKALLALVIAPIATELPEKFNSVIWVRQGKDTLAMGNITGAMVFQSTIPTSVALVFASGNWAIAAASTAAPAPRAAGALADPEHTICYFEGKFVPMTEAKVSIMTHAFMYGTAVFEGIRGYWNPEQGQLYALKVREHVERIRNSCKILLMDNIPPVDELTGL